MVMPNKAYREFADLYEKEFGEKLTQTQCRIKADKLMKLFNKVIFSSENKGGKENVN